MQSPFLVVQPEEINVRNWVKVASHTPVFQQKSVKYVAIPSPKIDCVNVKRSPRLDVINKQKLQLKKIPLTSSSDGSKPDAFRIKQKNVSATKEVSFKKDVKLKNEGVKRTGRNNMPQDLNKHTILSERLTSARREIEDLKLELQTMLKPNIITSDVKEDEVKPLSENVGLKESKTFAEFKKSCVKKPLVSSTNLRKSTPGGDATPVINDGTCRLRSYDRKMMREFIKKQRQMRKEKLHVEQEKKRVMEEERKKKLRELKEKTLQLVNENVKKSQKKTKSKRNDLEMRKMASVPNLSKITSFPGESRGSRRKPKPDRSRSSSVVRGDYPKPWRRTRSVSNEVKVGVTCLEIKTGGGDAGKVSPKSQDKRKHICMGRNIAARKIQRAYRNYRKFKELTGNKERVALEDGKRIAEEEVGSKMEGKSPGACGEMMVNEIIGVNPEKNERSALELEDVKANLERSPEIQERSAPVAVDADDAVLPKRNTPIWLQPPTVLPYPYNFISAVKRKLDIVTGNVHKTQDASVQNSISGKTMKDVSTQMTYSPQINISTLPRLEEFNLSHKSQRIIDSSVPVLRSPDTVKELTGNVSEHHAEVHTDSGTDTTKHIPEISDEESNANDHFSFKSDSDSTKYLNNAPVKLTVEDKVPLSKTPIKTLELKGSLSFLESKSSRTRYPSDIESILSHYSKSSRSNKSYSDDFNSTSGSTTTYISGIKIIEQSESDGIDLNTGIKTDFPSLSKNLKIPSKNTKIKHFQPQTKFQTKRNVENLNGKTIDSNLKSINVSDSIGKPSKTDDREPTHSNNSIRSLNRIPEGISDKKPHSIWAQSLDSMRNVSPNHHSITDHTKPANTESIGDGGSIMDHDSGPIAEKPVLQASQLENLSKPTVNLKMDKENLLTDTKVNSNQIHLKFQVHLLNSFNSSLQQFIAIEKSLYGDQDKENQHGKTEEGSAIAQELTKGTVDLIPTITYRRGCDSDYTGDFAIRNIDDTLLSTTVDSVISRGAEEGAAPGRGDCAGVSLGLYDELIKDEDSRLEHLKAVLKLRDKALLDRTKGELAWLEIRKRQLRESGQLNDVTMIKKRQRGLIIKLEQERHEMQRLKQAHKQAAKQRKNALKEQKNLIKHQLSSTDQIPTKMRRISRHERRQSGPMKVYRLESKMEHLSETTVSRRSSTTEETVNMTTSSLVTKVSERVSSESDVGSVTLAVQQTEKRSMDAEKVKKALLMKEEALERRRREAERLLEWHKRLKEEEARVAELERRANSIPMDTMEERVRILTGAQLNYLWSGITGSDDRKFDDHKRYRMSKRSVDRFCQNARKVFKEIAEERGDVADCIQKSRSLVTQDHMFYNLRRGSARSDTNSSDHTTVSEKSILDNLVTTIDKPEVCRDTGSEISTESTGNTKRSSYSSLVIHDRVSSSSGLEITTDTKPPADTSVPQTRLIPSITTGNPTLKPFQKEEESTTASLPEKPPHNHFDFDQYTSEIKEHLSELTGTSHSDPEILKPGSQSPVTEEDAIDNSKSQGLSTNSSSQTKPSTEIPEEISLPTPAQEVFIKPELEEKSLVYVQENIALLSEPNAKTESSNIYEVEQLQNRSRNEVSSNKNSIQLPSEKDDLVMKSDEVSISSRQPIFFNDTSSSIYEVEQLQNHSVNEVSSNKNSIHLPSEKDDFVVTSDEVSISSRQPIFFNDASSSIYEVEKLQNHSINEVSSNKNSIHLSSEKDDLVMKSDEVSISSRQPICFNDTSSSIYEVEQLQNHSVNEVSSNKNSIHLPSEKDDLIMKSDEVSISSRQPIFFNDTSSSIYEVEQLQNHSVNEVSSNKNSIHLPSENDDLVMKPDEVSISSRQPIFFNDTSLSIYEVEQLQNHSVNEVSSNKNSIHLPSENDDLVMKSDEVSISSRQPIFFNDTSSSIYEVEQLQNHSVNEVSNNKNSIHLPSEKDDLVMKSDEVSISSKPIFFSDASSSIYEVEQLQNHSVNEVSSNTNSIHLPSEKDDLVVKSDEVSLSSRQPIFFNDTSSSIYEVEQLQNHSVNEVSNNKNSIHLPSEKDDLVMKSDEVSISSKPIFFNDTSSSIYEVEQLQNRSVNEVSSNKNSIHLPSEKDDLVMKSDEVSISSRQPIFFNDTSSSIYEVEQLQNRSVNEVSSNKNSIHLPSEKDDLVMKSDEVSISSKPIFFNDASSSIYEVEQLQNRSVNEVSSNKNSIHLHSGKDDLVMKSDEVSISSKPIFFSDASSSIYEVEQLQNHSVNEVSSNKNSIYLLSEKTQRSIDSVLDNIEDNPNTEKERELSSKHSHIQSESNNDITSPNNLLSQIDTTSQKISTHGKIDLFTKSGSNIVQSYSLDTQSSNITNHVATSPQFSFDIKQSDDDIVIEITDNSQPNLDENIFQNSLTSNGITDTFNNFISSDIRTSDIDDGKCNESSKSQEVFIKPEQKEKLHIDLQENITLLCEPNAKTESDVSSNVYEEEQLQNLSINEVSSNKSSVYLESEKDDLEMKSGEVSIGSTQSVLLNDVSSNVYEVEQPQNRSINEVSSNRKSIQLPSEKEDLEMKSDEVSISSKQPIFFNDASSSIYDVEQLQNHSINEVFSNKNSIQLSSKNEDLEMKSDEVSISSRQPIYFNDTSSSIYEVEQLQNHSLNEVSNNKKSMHLPSEKDDLEMKSGEVSIGSTQSVLLNDTSSSIYEVEQLQKHSINEVSSNKKSTHLPSEKDNLEMKSGEVSISSSDVCEVEQLQNHSINEVSSKKNSIHLPSEKENLVRKSDEVSIGSKQSIFLNDVSSSIYEVEQLQNHSTNEVWSKKYRVHLSSEKEDLSLKSDVVSSNIYEAEQLQNHSTNEVSSKKYRVHRSSEKEDLSLKSDDVSSNIYEAEQLQNHSTNEVSSKKYTVHLSSEKEDLALKSDVVSSNIYEAEQLQNHSTNEVWSKKYRVHLSLEKEDLALKSDEVSIDSKQAVFLMNDNSDEIIYAENFEAYIEDEDKSTTRSDASTNKTASLSNIPSSDDGPLEDRISKDRTSRKQLRSGAEDEASGRKTADLKNDLIGRNISGETDSSSSSVIDECLEKVPGPEEALVEEGNKEDAIVIGVSHVDIRKRVSEILADASAPPRSGKGPRVQDLYVTTYDVISPDDSASEIRSPRNELHTKEKILFISETPYGSEAEELLRKQLEIEQEIKHLEQQQQHDNIPYCYMREIPNKPPPPYKPPEFPGTVTPSPPISASTSVIPAQRGQVQRLVGQASDIIYRAVTATNGNLTDAALKPHRDPTHKMTAEDFIFDLCKEIALDIYKPNSNMKDVPSWKRVKNKFSNFLQRKPKSKTELETIINRKVLQLLNFEPVHRKDNLIIRWSRKKRDQVDEILVLESQVEEADWTNYNTDEMTIKDKLTNEILIQLLDDTVVAIASITAKKKTLSWFS